MLYLAAVVLICFASVWFVYNAKVLIVAVKRFVEKHFNFQVNQTLFVVILLPFALSISQSTMVSALFRYKVYAAQNLNYRIG